MRQFEPSRLRETVLRMAYAGSTVHIPCALSIVEILAVLYRSHLNLGPGGPTDAGRDYLILSKGHGVMAQYACLRELGWLSDEDIRNYTADGTSLTGLSDAHVPGLEVTSGSLGHGLSVGLGLAWAALRRGSAQRCFAVVGDGELNEGSIWEALQFAADWKLSNVLVIIDANGWQAMGRTSDVLGLGSIASRLAAFGFETREVDGHDEDALDAAVAELMVLPGGSPRGLVAHTVKGKGIAFMEDDNRWHYTRLTAETYAAGLAAIRT
jgi:transketolase